MISKEAKKFLEILFAENQPSSERQIFSLIDYAVGTGTDKSGYSRIKMHEALEDSPEFKAIMEIIVDYKRIAKVEKFHMSRIKYHDEMVEYWIEELKNAKTKPERRKFRELISNDIFEGNVHRKILRIKQRRKVPKIALRKD